MKWEGLELMRLFCGSVKMLIVLLLELVDLLLIELLLV